MKNFVIIILILSFLKVTGQERIFVSPDGDDLNVGSKKSPVASVQQALKRLKTTEKEGNKSPFEIILLDGVYYIPETILFDETFAGLQRPLVIRADREGKATLSAGHKLNVQWKDKGSNRYEATVPDEINDIPYLYADNATIRLARYPNYVADIYPFGGYAADALSKERIRTWSAPEGGYIHALHRARWGGMHFKILGKEDDGTLRWEGGWQNNRPSEMHTNFRFVEGIKEELDATGEWFFDKSSRVLSFIAKPGEDPNKMTFVVPQFESIFSFNGKVEQPIRDVNIKGLTLKHTLPTFMKSREPLMRSDWTIYRQAAIFMEGVENIAIQDCYFSDLGGNAVFVSGYAKDIVASDNLVENIGASAFAVVGRSEALFNPVYSYNEAPKYEEISRAKGPKTEAYPRDITISGNLVRYIGTIEKQSAGVQIQVASRVNVLHNTIYQVPRAGINIGDGAFGGHDLAFNDVFETVLETSDHGAFNSWGRDRFWHPNRGIMDQLVKKDSALILLDAYQNTKIRNNRFQCDHGWDIDLDDGSSNYSIYNNLCLSGGIKLREGFHRSVRNNVLVNNTFHPHVWFYDSRDTFQNNIVMSAYGAIQIPEFGDQVDYNVFTSKQDLLDAQETHRTDLHSITARISFNRPEKLDFAVKMNSQLKGYFQNFSMMNFGVTKGSLKKQAAVPVVKALIFETATAKETLVDWNGFLVKTMSTLGEQSATGTADIKGILVVNSTKGKYKGIQDNDVILYYGEEDVSNLEQLLRAEVKYRWMESRKIKIWRNQRLMEIRVH